MVKLLITWLITVGIAGHYLFTGLVAGIPNLEVSVAKIFSLIGG